MRIQYFVDETKAKGYVMVAAAVSDDDVAIARKVLRQLVLPGQRGLHLKDERASRGREIADTVARMSAQGLGATVYDAGKRHRTDTKRRAACIDALVGDVLRGDSARITFDRDESLVSRDRQRMIELTRTADAKHRLSYVHEARSAELLLAIPDAIAWCWAKGGDWRRRVAPVITGIREV